MRMVQNGRSKDVLPIIRSILDIKSISSMYFVHLPNALSMEGRLDHAGVGDIRPTVKSSVMSESMWYVFCIVYVILASSMTKQIIISSTLDYLGLSELL